jgi:transcription elongation factor GreB
MLHWARAMNKAFTKESEVDDDALPDEPWPLPPGVKNYVTPSGHRALKDEHASCLADLEKPLEPKVRKETARRIRALERRLAEAEVVDPAGQPKDRVLFGAKARVRDQDDVEKSYWIVGVDQADASQGRISWLSPLAKVLIGKQVGDVATLRAPAGERELEILGIEYPG